MGYLVACCIHTNTNKYLLVSTVDHIVHISLNAAYYYPKNCKDRFDLQFFEVSRLGLSDSQACPTVNGQLEQIQQRKLF